MATHYPMKALEHIAGNPLVASASIGTKADSFHYETSFFLWDRGYNNAFHAILIILYNGHNNLQSLFFHSLTLFLPILTNLTKGNNFSRREERVL